MTLLSVLLSVCFLLLSIEGFVNCLNYLVSPLNCHICVVAGNSYFPFLSGASIGDEGKNVRIGTKE